MKATGIVRRLDSLGRIVLPIELRRTLNISVGDAVEFYTDGDGLRIRKFDKAGDLEQVLDNFERVIREKDYFWDGALMDKLLDHVQQMRAIVEKPHADEAL